MGCGSSSSSFSEEDIKALVDKDIQGAVLYTTSSCPYCHKALALMRKTGAKYKEVQLDRVSDGSAIRSELQKRTGRTSVPSIWIAGSYIGGMNDGGMGGLSTLHRNGQLESLLKQVS